MRSALLGLLGLLGVLGYVASAATTAVAAPAPKLTVPKVPFEKVVLPNGLQVILHVDKKLPLVHVNLWYHVGSKNEKPGHTGLAHLFEHLMLQGSKNASEDFFSMMQKAGARPGRDSNGTTSQDRTNYFSTAPSGSLEFLLWVHSDLLATLLDGLTQQKLDNQREVVRNERRQGLDNVPYGRWYKLASENLFPMGHPYSWPVIGSHEDLAAASIDDVKAFFRTYYTPNNLSLVVTGDFDPAVAKKLIEKYFGAIAPGPALDRPHLWIPRLDGEKVVEVNDRVPQERVFLIWPAPAIGGNGEQELNLAAAILGDGLSARLQKSLVYDKKLASMVNVFNDPNEIAGGFYVDALARPGASLAEIERSIGVEIARLAKDGPSAGELERARTKTVTQITSSLEVIGAFGGVADVLNSYNTFYGDPAKLVDDVQRILKVTPQSLRAAVATWVATPNRVVLRFHPEGSSRPAVADVDRSKRPALGADTAFHAPTVATDKLDNGLEVYVVEQHDLPVVSVSIVARAGSVLDPPGKEGLAWLAADTMTRGSKTRNALAMADALGDLGASLKTTVVLAHGGPSQSLEVQKANVPAAVALLADIVRSPAYAEADVDRERKLQVDRIEQLEKDAQPLAARLRMMVAFGPAHPYGRPTLGFRRTAGAADVAAFHASAWKPNAVALVLVGDITPAEARALAQKELGSWSGAAPAPPAIPPATPPAKGKVILVDRPDAAQTYALHVYGAPAQKGDDYYAWRLACDVMGGFAGRLNMNLRQNKGYSYGVSAIPILLAGGMAWVGQGAVQTDKTRESVVEFEKELSGLAGGKAIGAKELDEARLGLIRNYAAGFGTNSDVALRVADLWSRRWPLAELEREPGELERASLADVQAAAKRYAVPADATLVLIGDRAKIEAGVRALNVGDVLVVDAEGSPVGQK